jgi:hypothetical protein
MSEIHQIERTLASVAMRPSAETAKEAVRFFTACLEQRGYPYKEQVAQEFLALVSLLDYLIIIHSLEHGALILQTPDMQITLKPSYDALNTEEDLSVPSLGVLDALPADAPLTFIIGVNPATINDKTLAQMSESGQQKLLNVRIEAKGQERPEPEPTLLPDTILPSQDLLGSARKIIANLGLSVDFLETQVNRLLKNTRQWREEEALLALTIVFKNVRVVVGLISHNQLIDKDKLNKLKADLQKEGIQKYTLGVFLIPPASPPADPEHWKQDDKTYKDVPLGSISQGDLKKAEHLLLQ